MRISPPARCVALAADSALPFSIAIAACMALPLALAAQQPTAPVPRPYDVVETPDFARAVKRHTRTRSGQPGPAYWQQQATYRIEAQLDPHATRLRGTESVRYINNSPDTLRQLALYLRQNLFAPGAVRHAPTPVTGGVTLQRVAAGGRTLTSSSRRNTPGYRVDGTILWITLPEPLTPRGGRVQLSFSWAYTPAPVPSDGREGTDGDVYMMGYWYPQLAVYDDVSGWVTDPYTSEAEFYMGYADYDVRMTVPTGWVVGATGTLQNPGDVLTSEERDRLAAARHTDSLVHVVTARDIAAGHATAHGRQGTLTWHFTAHNVRDFAWVTCAHYLWDASHTVVGAHDTVAINNLYRAAPAGATWVQSVRGDRDAIDFLSRFLWPYPYPQITSAEGVLESGGMEYPMFTILESWRDTLELHRDLMHEISHMWFPMQVGSDETRYPWMDEGLAEFNASQGDTLEDLVGRGVKSAQRSYLALARRGGDVPLMRPGNEFPPDNYFTIEYQKATSVFVALRAILGDSVFQDAYRTYGKRWLGKHPEPYDFFNTFNSVSGRNLSWFWHSWFYQAWTLDQAIANVRQVGDSVEIMIEDRGLAPMPVPLAITRADGSVQRVELPVDPWLDGARRQVVRVAGTPRVTQVVIDPEHVFPYIDRSALTWPRVQRVTSGSTRSR
ncbi:MAG TPA: M1 family metallopeptidase [Gemmatimonadaceae bacterium]|nr:M1 family metallopeptidase [Gemmatimonadaceae bacterium]